MALRSGAQIPRAGRWAAGLVAQQAHRAKCLRQTRAGRPAPPVENARRVPERKQKVPGVLLPETSQAQKRGAGQVRRLVVAPQRRPTTVRGCHRPSARRAGSSLRERAHWRQAQPDSGVQGRGLRLASRRGGGPPLVRPRSQHPERQIPAASVHWSAGAPACGPAPGKGRPCLQIAGRGSRYRLIASRVTANSKTWKTGARRAQRASWKWMQPQASAGADWATRSWAAPACSNQLW